MIPLFLYGSLLDPRVLARRAGTPALAARLEPAELAGWRRVVRAGACWPTLRRDRAGRLAGALLAPSAAALGRLSAYEGPAYRLRPVTIATRRGPRAALAWIASDATFRPWPTHRCP